MSESPHGTTRSYIVGFVLSVVLTLTAYILITQRSLANRSLILAVAVLAAVQFLAQLFFFLHLGGESRPRVNLITLLFALLVVFIIVFGSLWIMNNLDYNHAHTMTPEETDTFIRQDEGIYR